VGDANNDGYNDIITGDINDDTVTILNGTSGGIWEEKYTLSANIEPRSVFVADTNNDGYNDILAAQYGSDTVTIYNGTASGDWEAKYTIDVGTDPMEVFVGDANNDGYNDILTADGTDDTVTIYNGTGGWDYRKKIVIDSDQVAGNLANFPMLFTITDSDLKNKAQPDGDDIYFTSSDGKTKLNHEIESYNNTNGELIAWVNITSLSSSTDTVIYMYYGNPSALDQSNVTGVWDENFVAVYHLSETPTGTVYDSTSNNIDLTPNAMEAGDQVVGPIDGSINFDGDPERLASSNTITIESFTFEAWVSSDSWSGWHAFASVADSGGTLWRDFGSYNDDPFIDSDGITYDIAQFQSGSAWRHIVGRYNDSAGSNRLRGFINGTITGDTANPSLSSLTGYVALGSLYWTGSWEDYFDGRLDEVRISNISRSNDWIATEFKNQNDTNSFYSVFAEELIGYQWVELYNYGTTATNLSGWSLSDNDTNSFNLTGAGEIPIGGYLICHLGQTGTDSSTNVYGPPANMLEATDDLALLDSSGNIIDYVAWGGDAGTDDDLAVTRGEWTDGTYIDTSLLQENETIGRDKDSTDTNSPADWENVTNEADPYGVNATMAT
jgi:hypothetical protein